jgi:hypothetical protein
VSSDLPKAPRGTGGAGRALWRSIVEKFELSAHEQELLAQAVRVADRIHQLEQIVDCEGVMVCDPKRGIDIPHPGLVEARAQRLVLARILACLRLAEDDTGRRPQHRSLRGAYRPRVLAGGGNGAA